MVSGWSIVLPLFLLLTFFVLLVLVRSTFFYANIFIHTLQKFSISLGVVLVQWVSEPGISQTLLHGRDSHILVEVPDLEHGGVKTCYEGPKGFFLSLFDREEGIKSSWHPPIGAEVSHEGVFKLLKKVDAFWSEPKIPGSSSLLKDGREANTHESIICPLDHQESLIALKMITGSMKPSYGSTCDILNRDEINSFRMHEEKGGAVWLSKDPSFASS